MKKDFPITLIPKFCLTLEALGILEKDSIQWMIRLHTYWVNYKEELMFEGVREFLFKLGDLSFYSNGTYKIGGRDDIEISFWKLEDDKFYFKHQINHEWDWDGSDTEFECKFKEKYNLYLLGLIEKELES